MNPNDIQTTIDKLRPATPEEIESQRAGMLNYVPGPRQAGPFKRRPYVSIDIETTGVDPEHCQILEFGAVIDDWKTPVEELPRFHAYVYHDRFTGAAFGLSLNAAILKKMHDASETMQGKNQIIFKGDTFVRPKMLCRNVKGWLRANSIETGPALLAAGKNFAGFDRQFLNRLPDFNLKFCHRTIDPGMLFWNPDTDETPPSTKDCMRRSGLPGEVAHTAIDDALAVIRMIRHAKPPQVKPPCRPARRPYTIALKLDQRPFYTMAEAAKLIDKVRGVVFRSPLVDLQNAQTIIVIEADEVAIAGVRECIGEFCHVEEEILHSTQVGGHGSPAEALATRLTKHFMENNQFTK